MTAENLHTLLPAGGLDIVEQAVKSIRETLDRAERHTEVVRDHLAKTGMDDHAKVLMRGQAKMHMACEQLSAMLDMLKMKAQDESEDT